MRQPRLSSRSRIPYVAKDLVRIDIELFQIVLASEVVQRLGEGTRSGCKALVLFTSEEDRNALSSAREFDCFTCLRVADESRKVAACFGNGSSFPHRSPNVHLNVHSNTWPNRTPALAPDHVVHFPRQILQVRIPLPVMREADEDVAAIGAFDEGGIVEPLPPRAPLAEDRQSSAVERFHELDVVGGHSGGHTFALRFFQIILAQSFGLGVTYSVEHNSQHCAWEEWTKRTSDAFAAT
jgi:hypothetical protein